MKKLTTGLLLLMLFSIISGCTKKEATIPDTEKIKIGMIIWSDTETHGKDCVKFARMAVTSAGGELYVKTGAITVEDQISDIKELLEDGCNGISICAMSDSCVLQISKICREYQVPFVLWDSHILQQSVQDELKANPYYVGETYTDNELMGYELTVQLYKKGVRNLAVLSYLSDNSAVSGREAGIRRACRELPGMTIVENIRGMVMPDTVDTLMDNLITAYPQINGVIIIGGTQDYIIGVSDSIAQNNKTGEIQIGGIDFCDDMERLMTEGKLSAVSGGHSITTFYSSLMLINELTGYPLTDTPMSLEIPFYTLTRKEQLPKYEKILNGMTPPYTEEGLLKLLKKYNPELTYEEFAAYTQKHIDLDNNV